MAKKMNWFSRTVYSLVGVAGGYSLIWMLASWQSFWGSMPLVANLAVILLTVGGLNWGIVAITGDCKKDLFGLLGLK